MPDLVMPDVGESVTEGTVTRWLKHEGDSVALDETVVEIETEKVEVEVPSPFEGTLVRILVQEGEVAPVGAALAEFAVGTESAPASDGASDGAAPSREQAAAARAPTTAGSRATGQRAAATDASQGDGARPEEPRRERRFSPVVLRLAEEHAVDLALVQGTGIEGRVTRQDVLRYIENPVAHTVPPSSDAGVVGVSQKPAAPRVARPAAAPDAEESAASPAMAPRRAAAAPGAGDTLERLSATRRTIAANMLHSHQTVPVAWMAIEADVTGLVALREAQKSVFRDREGVALTYLPFFIQAVVAGLKAHPALNSSWTEDGIATHHAYHIGVAVAAESGLVVPVVHDADGASIAGLARALEDIGGRARERRLTMEDIRGGTFTVDNTGAFGSVLSQPIVPPGQAAIITTEAIRRELRVGAGDSFAARSVMNLCLSFDHRILDGAEAGRFMQDVRAHLEGIGPGDEVY